MKCSIRTSKNSDIEDLLLMNEFLHSMHVQNAPNHFCKFNSDEVRKWFSNCIEDDGFIILVAEYGSELIGYSAASVKETKINPFCKSRNYMEIDHVYIDPTFRKLGVAKKLILKIFDLAKLKGVNELELSSWCFNQDAVKAFTALGFAARYCRFHIDINK